MQYENMQFVISEKFIVTEDNYTILILKNKTFVQEKKLYKKGINYLYFLSLFLKWTYKQVLKKEQIQPLTRQRTTA